LFKIITIIQTKNYKNKTIFLIFMPEEQKEEAAQEPQKEEAAEKDEGIEIKNEKKPQGE